MKSWACPGDDRRWRQSRFAAVEQSIRGQMFAHIRSPGGHRILRCQKGAMVGIGGALWHECLRKDKREIAMMTGVQGLRELLDSLHSPPVLGSNTLTVASQPSHTAAQY